jgi:hypothetical protein
MVTRFRVNDNLPVILLDELTYNVLTTPNDITKIINPMNRRIACVVVNCEDNVTLLFPLRISIDNSAFKKIYVV